MTWSSKRVADAAASSSICRARCANVWTADANRIHRCPRRLYPVAGHIFILSISSNLEASWFRLFSISFT